MKGRRNEFRMIWRKASCMAKLYPSTARIKRNPVPTPCLFSVWTAISLSLSASKVRAGLILPQLPVCVRRQCSSPSSSCIWPADSSVLCSSSWAFRKKSFCSQEVLIRGLAQPKGQRWSVLGFHESSGQLLEPRPCLSPGSLPCSLLLCRIAPHCSDCFWHWVKS